VLQAEYKEFLALGHGDIFDLDITRAVVLDRFGEMKPPPWTLPGSDLSDYFNYNLDPESWRFYCSVIDAYRCDFGRTFLRRAFLQYLSFRHSVAVHPGAFGISSITLRPLSAERIGLACATAACILPEGTCVTHFEYPSTWHIFTLFRMASSGRLDKGCLKKLKCNIRVDRFFMRSSDVRQARIGESRTSLVMSRCGMHVVRSGLQQVSCFAGNSIVF
jgi:hypothetical protein